MAEFVRSLSIRVGENTALRVLRGQLTTAQTRAEDAERNVEDFLVQLENAGSNDVEYNRGFDESTDGLIRVVHENYDRHRLTRHAIKKCRHLVGEIGGLVYGQQRNSTLTNQLLEARGRVAELEGIVDDRQVVVKELQEETAELLEMSARLTTVVDRAGDAHTAVRERNLATRRANAAEAEVRVLRAQVANHQARLGLVTAVRDEALRRFEEGQGEVERSTCAAVVLGGRTQFAKEALNDVVGGSGRVLRDLMRAVTLATSVLGALDRQGPMLRAADNLLPSGPSIWRPLVETCSLVILRSAGEGEEIQHTEEVVALPYVSAEDPPGDHGDEEGEGDDEEDEGDNEEGGNDEDAGDNEDDGDDEEDGDDAA